MEYVAVFLLSAVGCFTFIAVCLVLDAAVTALVSGVRCPKCNGRPAWLGSGVSIDFIARSRYFCLRCGSQFTRSP